MTQEQELELLELIKQVKESHPQEEVVIYGNSEAIASLGIETEEWHGTRVLIVNSYKGLPSSDNVYIMPLNTRAVLRLLKLPKINRQNNLFILLTKLF